VQHGIIGLAAVFFLSNYKVLLRNVAVNCDCYTATPYGYYMGGATTDLMTSPAVNGSTATATGGLLQAVNRC